MSMLRLFVFPCHKAAPILLRSLRSTLAGSALTAIPCNARVSTIAPSTVCRGSHAKGRLRALTARASAEPDLSWSTSAAFEPSVAEAVPKHVRALTCLSGAPRSFGGLDAAGCVQKHRAFPAWSFWSVSSSNSAVTFDNLLQDWCCRSKDARVISIRHRLSASLLHSL